MGKIVALSFIQIKSVLKQWKLLLACFLVPILLVFGIALIVTSIVKPEAIDPFQVAIVDHDQSMETGYIIEHMTSSEHVKSMLDVTKATEEEAWRLLQENQITAIMIIPEHFSKDLARGINTPVMVVGNSQRPFQSQLIRYYMESAADFVSAAQSGVNTVDYFLREIDAPKEVIQQAFTASVVDFTFHALGRNDIYEIEEVDALHTADVKQYYLGSALIGIVMIWAFVALWMTRSVTDETIFRRLIISGVSTLHRFTGRLITTSFILVLQILLIYPVLIKTDLFENHLEIILLLTGIGLVFILFFFCIETVMKSEKPMLLVSTLTIIIFLVLGGHIIPIVYFPTWLESITAYIPNYWAMTGYSIIVMENEGIYKVLIALISFMAIFLSTSILFERQRIRRMIA